MTADWSIVAIAFLFGAAAGSFSNVVIFRLHDGRSPIRGRSACPHCGRTLTAVDLVPIISFLTLRGRCRTCRQPISWQYPLVELAVAVTFAAMIWRFGLTPEAVVGMVLSVFLTIIFVYDLRYQLILDRISLPAMALALIGSLVIGRPVLDLLLGAVIGAGLFALQFVLSRGRWIGGGDIRLGAVLGFALGWKLTLVALVLSYLSGSVVAIWLLLRRRREWGSVVPFGTFLSLSGVVCFLWGEAILGWYLNGDFFYQISVALLQWYNPTVP